jgi:hypothetical protein
MAAGRPNPTSNVAGEFPFTAVPQLLIETRAYALR